VWAALAAPFDSSGACRGEERAPDALRAAGLTDVFEAIDRGDVAAPLRNPTRDPELGSPHSRSYAPPRRRRAVAVTLARRERPPVVGGDCSLLLSGGRCR
jgi:arginase